jgi:hypothetical protein
MLSKKPGEIIVVFRMKQVGDFRNRVRRVGQVFAGLVEAVFLHQLAGRFASYRLADAVQVYGGNGQIVGKLSDRVRLACLPDPLLKPPEILERQAVCSRCFLCVLLPQPVNNQKKLL